MRTTKKLHTHPKPARGEPRQCQTRGCTTLFTPGKNGWGKRCARCHHAEAAGRQPGPRLRQPPGQAKVRVRSYVHPEMHTLLTPALLAEYGVETPGEFLVLAGARLLGRTEYEPTKKKPTPTKKDATR